MPTDATAWIQAQEARLWARLARLRASGKQPIVAAMQEAKEKRLAVGMQLGGCLFGVLIMWLALAIRSHVHHTPQILGCVFLMLLGVFLALGMFFGVHVGKWHERLAQRWWVVPLDRTQISRVKEWARAHEQVRDTLVRWSAQSHDMAITSWDYQALEGICERVEALREQLRVHEELKENTRAILHGFGRFDEAASLRDHHLLQQASPQAKVSTPAKRL